MNVKLMLHKSPPSSTVLPNTGNIKRDESPLFLCLSPARGLIKCLGPGAAGEKHSEWQIDMFQHFKIPFRGVSAEGCLNGGR